MGSSRAEGQQPQSQRFPRSSRIRRGSEIRGLIQDGTRARSSYLDVFTKPAARKAPRFGAVVPRFGRTVVLRNRLRRLLRELARTEILPRLDGRGRNVDVLVRSRPMAYGVEFVELRADLVRLMERLCPDVSFSD